jgi:hypothetical protein
VCDGGVGVRVEVDDEKQCERVRELEQQRGLNGTELLLEGERVARQTPGHNGESELCSRLSDSGPR